MDHYLDIQLLPDPEFEEQVLMNALFAKFHRGMTQTAPEQIGVSFPDVNKRLGGRLRLHGRAEALTSLMATNWMKGLTDYARVSGIQSIPNGCQHRIVRRIQAKSVHNKRKRSVTKGWLSAEEAKSKIRDTQQKKLKMPYLQIKSLSNGNSMRVYIEHGDLVDTPASGAFNSYGLSSVATIPWF